MRAVGRAIIFTHRTARRIGTAIRAADRTAGAFDRITGDGLVSGVVVTVAYVGVEVVVVRAVLSSNVTPHGTRGVTAGIRTADLSAVGAFDGVTGKGLARCVVVTIIRVDV